MLYQFFVFVKTPCNNIVLTFYVLYAFHILLFCPSSIIFEIGVFENKKILIFRKNFWMTTTRKFGYIFLNGRFNFQQLIIIYVVKQTATKYLESFQRQKHFTILPKTVCENLCLWCHLWQSHLKPEYFLLLPGGNSFKNQKMASAIIKGTYIHTTFYSKCNIYHRFLFFYVL